MVAKQTPRKSELAALRAENKRLREALAQSESERKVLLALNEVERRESARRVAAVRAAYAERLAAEREADRARKQGAAPQAKRKLRGARYDNALWEEIVARYEMFVTQEGMKPADACTRVAEMTEPPNKRSYESVRGILRRMHKNGFTYAPVPPSKDWVTT